jgi:deoxyribodipyrimidine photolyase-related protein
MKTLRLILGDQLNRQHSWFNHVNDDHIYVMFEMRQETDYVSQHIQKVIGFFSAMRHFEKTLESKGHHVIYYRINDKRNTQQLKENLEQLIEEYQIEVFEYLLPDEYRLDKQLREFCSALDIKTSSCDTEHFYSSRNELQLFFKGNKQLLMERFYRHMRKKHDVLMEGGQPLGGSWNYDKSNRKKWKGEPTIPPPILFENEVSEVLEDIKSAGIETIGHFEGTIFNYPINEEQAIRQLQYFCEYLLQYFGDYQDALHTNEEFLFHSRLSFALNTKILSPKTVVNEAITYYKNHSLEIDISQIEGFVRQILGWREYMRGVYWKEMPGYARFNKLENQNKLPDFYWTGDTKMNCLAVSIKNSLNNAYAHHIQRLMITGNFALLIQVHPDQVDQWYLGIYIDAIEWVEITNTRGMSQFADGGIIATKPYVSSASYIHKMGNYCEKCSYNRTKRTGEDACPFNSLYWNFLDDKKKYLKNNHRMGMMYNLLSKIPEEELKQLKDRAYRIIENPDLF